MMSIDQGKPVFLFLLYKSAAFDTIDHSVLFSRLKDMFDLSDKVLEWFRLDLEQLSQGVTVHCNLSDVFSFCYLVYFMGHFLVFWISIPIFIGLLRSDKVLTSTCMLMAHSCIYHC